jgi:hypothetical protein
MVKGGPGGASLVMASTHHSALTELKYQDPVFENASVEFDDEKMAPTFKLLWGVPGRSNALNIASRLGVEAGVVEDARGRMGAGVAQVNGGFLVVVYGFDSAVVGILWSVSLFVSNHTRLTYGFN